MSITMVEVYETEYGEKVQLDTPYKAREYIKYMPWSRDDTVNGEELEPKTIAPDFEFSEGFASHYSWNPTDYVWEIDRDSIHEAIEYFESVGFDIDDETGLLLRI